LCGEKGVQVFVVAFLHTCTPAYQKRKQMKDETIIEKIHDSDIYGIFIELGAGIPLSTCLFEVEGASNTVFMAISPYNKEFQENVYELAPDRSVSFNGVKKIADYYEKHTSFSKKVNTIMVTSFQIGGGICNHGWVCLKSMHNTLFYHLTVKWEGNRKKTIESIGDYLLKILYNRNHQFDFDIPIDIIKNDKGETMIDLMLWNVNETNLMVFMPTGEGIRLEEAFRPLDKKLIYKGSFNPIHIGHVEIVNKTIDTLNTYQDIDIEQHGGVKDTYGVYFLISRYTVDKSPFGNVDLKKRINHINKCGYGVIISTQGKFIENQKQFSDRGFDDGFVYIMGKDTAKRLIKDDKKIFKERKSDPNLYMVFDRKGAGKLVYPNDSFMEIPLEESANSTTIRNLMDEIRNLTPEAIHPYFTL